MLDTLILPSSTYSSKRQSISSRKSDDGEEFLIPVAFDPNAAGHRSPQPSSTTAVDERPREYFSRATSSDSKSVYSPPADTTHIAFQEKRPENDHNPKYQEDTGSSSVQDLANKTNQQNVSRRDGAYDDNFRLRDVPKDRRSGDRHEHEESNVSKQQAEKPTLRAGTGPSAGNMQYVPPKRGDSLESKHLHTLQRKEVPGSFRSSHGGPTDSKSEIGSVTSSPAPDHTRTGSRTGEPPSSKRSLDISTRTGSPHARTGSGAIAPKESFSPSRAVGQSSMDTRLNHGRNESTHTTQSDAADSGPPQSMLRYSGGGDFSLDEDMARILRDFDENGNGNHESFLRRVSNSVRHGRSHSDKTQRLSKGQKEISSPITDENRDEVAYLKSELKRERQRIIEKDQKIAELESALNAAANIKQVNTELHEKRSTMVVLDAQKEIVLRELEVLTEHIATEKKNNAPLDVNKMSNDVLRDLAQAMRRLQENFSSQIEELIQKRNELVEEIGSLGRMKDKSFLEFEQLSLKNAQLAELNNQLVNQIQGLYKATNTTDGGRQGPNGLGIYSHQKDKASTASVDMRDMRRAASDTPGAPASGEEAEPVTVIQGPQVVNIRKAQPRKFNWKKGQNVAKGVTKGIKGAFSYQREGQQHVQQFTETGPYGSTPVHEASGSGMPRSHTHEVSRQGFGFFGNQKHKQSASKGQSNGNTPAVAELPAMGMSSPFLMSSYFVANEPQGCLVPIWSKDWKLKRESSLASSPGVSKKLNCEVRIIVLPASCSLSINIFMFLGMDVEGIYRKSGGSSQVQTVREGFERSSSYDISDPDLDIHAVTSALKQYFRKLPTPLITYPVYDKLLDACNITPTSIRIEVMQRGLQDLPRVHRDVLEFLVFHLKRVVEREKENLMTSQNIAVVFAPTIMRPESLSREMSDVQKKNETVQFLVDNCQEIFMGIEEC